MKKSKYTFMPSIEGGGVEKKSVFLVSNFMAKNIGDARRSLQFLGNIKINSINQLN